MMKRLFLILLGLLPMAGLQAQLRVELDFEQETYLPHEPLYAVVRIYNSSGQTLELGADNEWLAFTVESVDGHLVKQRKPVDVEGPFTLPSASRAKKMVNLAEAFELTRFGRYNVTATVRLKDWSEDFSSKAAAVGISTGVTLWESAFGIPNEQPDRRPEVRKFQLVQANHLKKLNLYVRIISEAGDDTFSLFPLGPLLGFSKPEPQLDRWSNLHVLYQSSGRLYLYHVITPDGLLLARQSWEIDAHRPRMTADADGRITIQGGTRRPSGDDLPPPELLSENTAPSPVPSEEDKPVNAQPATK